MAVKGTTSGSLEALEALKRVKEQPAAVETPPAEGKGTSPAAEGPEFTRGTPATDLEGLTQTRPAQAFSRGSLAYFRPTRPVDTSLDIPGLPSGLSLSQVVERGGEYGDPFANAVTIAYNEEIPS